MAYTPYQPYNGVRRVTLNPIVDVALIEQMLARLTDLNQRFSFLESGYQALAANAYGGVATNVVQQDDLDILQDQLMGLAGYVTYGALNQIPSSTTADYANNPAFSVRSYGVEARLTAIGA